MNPELLEPVTAAADPTPPVARKLSTDLRALLREANGRPVTIEELEGLLQGRGFAMFILLLAAPFLIPTPGLSVPFGIAIAVLGLRIVFGQKPSLPKFILRRQIKYSVLSSVVGRLATMIEKVEKRIKPRMHFLQDYPWMMNLIGVGIVASAFILALPLPIPFSNGLPAIAIMLLAAGMMERDGLLVLWGHICAVFSWVYLGFWWQAVIATWHYAVKALSDSVDYLWP
ncbi:MAG TPA: exopolysaccharide biosynthesis protein [Chthoniobacteraceae bacterium]|jgi:hypothetical protein